MTEKEALNNPGTPAVRADDGIGDTVVVKATPTAEPIDKTKKDLKMANTDKQVRQLQNRLREVLGQINHQKDKHNFNYGNLDKFLEHAQNGANATDYQVAAQELFAAISQLNQMAEILDGDIESGNIKKVLEKNDQRKKNN